MTFVPFGATDCFKEPSPGYTLSSREGELTSYEVELASHELKMNSYCPESTSRVLKSTFFSLHILHHSPHLFDRPIHESFYLIRLQALKARLAQYRIISIHYTLAH